MGLGLGAPATDAAVSAGAADGVDEPEAAFDVAWGAPSSLGAGWLDGKDGTPDGAAPGKGAAPGDVARGPAAWSLPGTVGDGLGCAGWPCAKLDAITKAIPAQ